MRKWAAILCGTLTVLALAGCSVEIGTRGSPPSPAAPVPVFTARARLGFSGVDNIRQGFGAAFCTGAGKFGGVGSDAEVKVFDSSGNQVGIGTVRETRGFRIVDNLKDPITSCAVWVVVNGVPAGSSYYDIQVGCTAPVRVAGADLMAEEVGGVIPSGCS